jgi:hypothetical protein
MGACSLLRSLRSFYPPHPIPEREPIDLDPEGTQECTLRKSTAAAMLYSSHNSGRLLLFGSASAEDDVADQRRSGN